MKSAALCVIASLDLVLPHGVFHSPTPLPHLLILLFSFAFLPLLHHHHFIFPSSFSFCHFLIVPLHLPPQHHLHMEFILPLPSSLMYAFLTSRFVSLAQPVIIISPLPHVLLAFSFPLSHPPCLSVALLYRYRLCVCVFVRRETEASQALVPAEQLPCKAIQIEMFAENNMCVITA